MDTLLDKPNLPAPKYVRAIDEVVEGLQQGDTAGRDHTGQQGSGGPLRTRRDGHARHGGTHPRDL